MEIGSILSRGICGRKWEVRHLLTCLEYTSSIGSQPLPPPDMHAYGALGLQSLETPGATDRIQGPVNQNGKTLWFYVYSLLTEI